jgi:hypothetical protein
MKTKIYVYAGLFIALIIGIITIEVLNDKEISVVKNCKIIELQQQQLIKGTKDNMSTEIRYLIITDKETFICESSIVNGKYDNSNLFWHFKKDQTYNLKVCGFGKSFLFDYRNVLEVVK